jgi:hypothetical protein
MNASDLRFLLGYARPYRGTLAFCALVMVAEGLFAFAGAAHLQQPPPARIA